MTSDRITGCFIGLAVGDALGVPIEFRSRQFLDNRPVKEMTGYGTWNQPPGTWSDDSSMTFCLAESLITGYDLTDIAEKFVRWYRHGYWGAHHKMFDVGGTTRIAIDRVIQGIDPRSTGESHVDSNGNGSLMRIAPAAIYFSGLNDDELFLRIKEISGITHAHIRSIFSCFILAKCMIGLLGGLSKWDAVARAMSDAQQFATANNIGVTELNVFERVLNTNTSLISRNEVRSSGYVIDTLEASLWCLLSTHSYAEAVFSAVNLGEDTDTTGCVVGALAGLLYGETSIPWHWRKLLARERDITALSVNFRNAIVNARS